MLNFLTNLFDENKKSLGRYQLVVDQINALEPKLKKLSDEKLAGQTAVFKKKIEAAKQQGQVERDILNALLPAAFATVREVSRRVLGMRHFDVQLVAGIALHHGTITEQKTGEGKTLTVTAPIYLNALFGTGVHLVTVNDYLAELGAGWMGPVYSFLGLKTAAIVHEKSSLYQPDFNSEERGDERLEHFEPISRQDAYAADITYGTNNEFGFDYLRDNMVQSIGQMVQRKNNGHHYAIVDEADSILIDEARTPLIISAPDSEPTSKYFEFAKMVTTLEQGADYTLEEKSRTVTLTDLGVKRIEQKLGVKNLYEEAFDVIHHVESALKAKTLYLRDKDYIVRDNQVVIVDEHTGRLMYGRRYSDGLHQAIEAKEGVPIQQESRTLATISIQNYFRLYEKLSGMTGTAATEAEEFQQIYRTPVLVVPTNVQVIRDDRSDIIYKTTAVKYSAIAAEVEKIHKIGQPILIGTRSIEHNEVIAEFLKHKHVPHQVLNAKNHEREAFIIADAGKKGAITVATNIAGRGVDIVLGGAKPELKDFRIAEKTTGKPSKKTLELAQSLQLPPSIDPQQYQLTDYQKALATWQKDHNEVVSLGGLFILGTERHESRRIDNQLRGRAGRQGDPGTSQFFISLEDDIMRIFGGEQITKVMDFLKFDENLPIEHKMIGKAIESAQVKVEGFFFDQRKRLVEFDDVMNKQREIIYKRRRRLLEKTAETSAENQDTSLKNEMLEYVKDEVTSLATLYAPQNYTPEEYNIMVKEFSKIIPFDTASQRELQKSLSQYHSIEEIVEALVRVTEKTYTSREKVLGRAQMQTIERLVTLSTIDEKWMDHLDAMDSLRDGIWMRGDKRTVLSEYKKEGFGMFEALIQQIESTIASRIFRANLQPLQMQPIPRDVVEQKDDIHESLDKEVKDAAMPTSAPENKQGSLSDLALAMKTAKTGAPKPTPGVEKVKIGRNDPCPCGSGLKYKRCGLINAPQHQG
ncbi:MAG: preprotein translocase subunit SecA [Candidatus Pacebacteria bacterium CG_4_10_14_0_8_um_filter_43_12]|nr:MAG: preprotein translocase subunit SecA [Candidatus Pacebacteria bacterium CG10_big_fil_rev_8_21_14_0_10_44_11]PIY79650.1 MAG: preprotein translocase subunit SecA [Candidatus Pacebacteria bacterium CG_4_10_14_0_8_um_filter_43_12]